MMPDRVYIRRWLGAVAIELQLLEGARAAGVIAIAGEDMRATIYRAPDGGQVLASYQPSPEPARWTWAHYDRNGRQLDFGEWPEEAPRATAERMRRAAGAMPGRAA